METTPNIPTDDNEIKYNELYGDILNDPNIPKVDDVNTGTNNTVKADDVNTDADNTVGVDDEHANLVEKRAKIGETSDYAGFGSDENGNDLSKEDLDSDFYGSSINPDINEEYDEGYDSTDIDNFSDLQEIEDAIWDTKTDNSLSKSYKRGRLTALKEAKDRMKKQLEGEKTISTLDTDNVDEKDLPNMELKNVDKDGNTTEGSPEGELQDSVSEKGENLEEEISELKDKIAKFERYVEQDKKDIEFCKKELKAMEDKVRSDVEKKQKEIHYDIGDNGRYTDYIEAMIAKRGGSDYKGYTNEFDWAVDNLKNNDKTYHAFLKQIETREENLWAAKECLDVLKQQLQSLLATKEKIS